MHFSLSFNLVFRKFELGWFHSNFYPTKVNVSVKDEAPQRKAKVRFPPLLNQPQSYRSESSSC